jgi:hypothetical protein
MLIEENNKMIAEFMQYPNHIDEESGETSYIIDSVHCVDYNLDFHTSWNWLMPVVEKIENYLSDNVGKVGYFDECLSSNNLEVRYQAVVEFINQYNESTD